MAQANQEIEIKLAVPDVKTGRRLLSTAGFRIHKRRVFEENTVFDTRGLKLRRAAELLRVRQAGVQSTITFKGRPGVSKHKSREELEVTVSDDRMIALIFERLGFRPVFRYQKYRTEFKLPKGEGVATLDETPIGVYLELEGAPSWIDRTARQLGFTEADYNTQSYGRLYQEWCKRQHVKPCNMVF